MIDKKIEEALNQYVDDDSIYDFGLFVKGFKAGINCLLDNFWHIADEEEPKPSPKDKYGSVLEKSVILLLAITKDDEIKIMWSTHEEEFDGDKDGYWLFHDNEGNDYNPFYGEVKKWLYINDLLKGGNNG